VAPPTPPPARSREEVSRRGLAICRSSARPPSIHRPTDKSTDKRPVPLSDPSDRPGNPVGLGPSREKVCPIVRHEPRTTAGPATARRRGLANSLKRGEEVWPTVWNLVLVPKRSVHLSAVPFPAHGQKVSGEKVWPIVSNREPRRGSPRTEKVCPIVADHRSGRRPRGEEVSAKRSGQQSGTGSGHGEKGPPTKGLSHCRIPVGVGPSRERTTDKRPVPLSDPRRGWPIPRKGLSHCRLDCRLPWNRRHRVEACPSVGGAVPFPERRIPQKVCPSVGAVPFPERRKGLSGSRLTIHD
jgi:hypothetical protein